uniref:Cyp5494A1 n=1 Tax=Phaffia rhodozyma TaxID=264483 RepID=A0A221SAH4_PHARH|nr:Cyp5494A1 [Phaffia rhodozyma]
MYILYQSIISKIIIPLAFVLGLSYLIHLATSSIPWSTIAWTVLSIVVVFSWLKKWKAEDSNESIARPVPRVEYGSWLNWSLVNELVNSDDTIFGSLAVFQDVMDKWGKTCNLRLLGENSILTADPMLAKFIMVDRFDNFHKGPKLFERLESFLGSGIFNSDGENWTKFRHLMRPHFTRAKIGDLSLFESQVDLAVKRIIAHRDSREPFNIQDIFQKLTFESSTVFLMGWQSDQPDEEREIMLDAFSQAFDEAQATVLRRIRVGTLWPLLELPFSHTNKPMTTIRSYLMPPIMRSIRRRQERERRNQTMSPAEMSEDDHSERTSLLDQLVEIYDDGHVIMCHLLNVLLAARDTTSSLLTSSIYVLSQNPKILKRLRDEIKDLPSCEADGLTRNHIGDIKYLRAFLDEVLRLYPPAPINIRRSIGSCILPATSISPEPLYMPPKTSIISAPFSFHRSTELWGPTALDFDPDRWLRSDPRLAEYYLKNPFIFQPFNVGPRICLGQQYAYTLSSLTLVRFLQSLPSSSADVSFSINLDRSEDHHPVGFMQTKKVNETLKEEVLFSTEFVLFVKGGLWVTLNDEPNIGDIINDTF